MEVQSFTVPEGSTKQKQTESETFTLTYAHQVKNDKEAELVQALINSIKKGYYVMRDGKLTLTTKGAWRELERQRQADR